MVELKNPFALRNNRIITINDLEGVQFCGLCKEFPCEKLPAMISWNPNIIEHLTTLRDEYLKAKVISYGE